MNQNTLTFRAAVPGDEALILSFIRHLAEYEKMLDQVVATEALLQEWIFQKRRAEVLLAFAGTEAVGIAIYFYNFSTFLGRAGIYLEDLFVLPEARGHGYGKAILAELARIAVDQGCGRLDWQCLDWNKPSIEFYRSLDAVSLDEWMSFRLTGPSLLRMAALAR